jgi:1-acyl-sn-glycerol-3-phosphate acyltransferase
MDRLPYGSPPCWWSPMLSRFWMRVIKPGRLLRAWRREGLREVETYGLENLRQAINAGAGVLIASNHAGHVDAYIFLKAGDRVGTPFHYMVAWQTMQLLGVVGRQILRWHGCFGVDREGYDFHAIRQAVEILRHSPHPLVMFPEGEIYHSNDHPFPFRTGTAMIALTAARLARRQIVCVPAAIKYQYTRDPMPKLIRGMAALEKRLLWQPRPDLPLAQRLYRFAEGLLATREMEYLGGVQSGRFANRIASLDDAILQRLEDKYQVNTRDAGVPERVTNIRRVAIKQLESFSKDDLRRMEIERNLEELCVVIQLYSYTQDYLDEDPSLEHLGEIVDKLEEDVLGVPTATVHTPRRAILMFGNPIEVKRVDKHREDVPKLTATLEEHVKALLTEIHYLPGQPMASRKPEQQPDEIPAMANGSPDSSMNQGERAAANVDRGSHLTGRVGPDAIGGFRNT